MNIDAIGHFETSLSLVIMVMMAWRMMIPANVDNEACGVVSDHIKKLSLKTQRVDLILTISP